MHSQQRGNHRHVADPIDQKAEPFAHRRDDDPRNRRPDQPRPIHHRRIQRNRVRQVRAVVHHLDHERLPRRHIEGIDHALKKHQRDHVPNLNHARERQRRQRQRLHHRKRLRRHQRFVPVPAIHPYARQRRQKK